MFNERGQRMKEAGPSEPVLILGLNGAPAAVIHSMYLIVNRKHVRLPISVNSCNANRDCVLRRLLTLDEVGRRLALGDFHELNIIVKGDVDGSVEALSDSLIKLSTPQIQVKCHS